MVKRRTKLCFVCPRKPCIECVCNARCPLAALHGNSASKTKNLLVLQCCSCTCMREVICWLQSMLARALQSGKARKIRAQSEGRTSVGPTDSWTESSSAHGSINSMSDNPTVHVSTAGFMCPADIGLLEAPTCAVCCCCWQKSTTERKRLQDYASLRHV